MSKQLHKNFVDEQVKLLLKSYVDKEIKIIISYQFSESKEEDSLNCSPDIEKIQIFFLSRLTGTLHKTTVCYS